MKRPGGRLAWLALPATILLALPAAPSSAVAPQMVTVVWNDSYTSQSFVRSDYDGGGAVTLASPSGGSAPTMSPDRSTLAYSTPTGVRAVKVSAGAPLLVLGAGDYDRPLWSPDSSKISVVKRESAEIERVVVAAADGSTSKVVFDDTSTTVGGFAGVGWAPDASKLVLTAYEDVGGGQPSRLMYLKLPSDGGALTEWANVVSVSMSPNGKRAYAVRRDGADVEVVRLDASLAAVEVVHTVADAPADWLPEIRWSADSTRLAFVSVSAVGNPSLLVLSAGGAVVHRYTNLPNEGTGLFYRDLALSPDGAVISLYGKTSTTQFQFEGLYLMDTVAGRSCLVTDIYEIGADHRGRFSADGRTLFVEGGNRLRSRSITRPDAALRVVPLGGPAEIVGFVDAPVGGVKADPCPLTPVQRDASLDPRRTSLRVYVYATYPQSCRDRVPVELQRRRDGRWVTVAKAQTNTDNTAVFDRPRVGTYRARAPRVVRGDYACLAATSSSFRA